MTKKDFIKKFDLTKGGKIYIYNGSSLVERVVYKTRFGDDEYVFLNNDLCHIKRYAVAKADITSCYSWYH